MTDYRTTPPNARGPDIPPTRPLGGGRVFALLVAVVSTAAAVGMVVAGSRPPESARPTVTTAGTGPSDGVGPSFGQVAPPVGETAPTGDDPTSGASAGDVPIGMVEFAFVPDHLELSAGIYIFTVRNDGAAPHELQLSRGGSHDHHFTSTRALGAGETQQLEVSLEPGTYEYACHIPGHYEAGMKGTLTVTD